MVVAHRTTKRAADEGLDLAPRMVRALDREVQGLRGDVVRGYREHVNIATGNLWRSVSAGADLVGNIIEVWMGLAEYWADVEFGTRPHVAPITTPSGGGLLRWVIAKGLVRNADRWQSHAKSLRSAVAAGTNKWSAHHLATVDEIAQRSEKHAAFAKHLRKTKQMPVGRETEAAGAGPASLHRAELSVAFAVQAGIARRGTRPHPNIRPAVEKRLPGFAAAVATGLRGREA